MTFKIRNMNEEAAIDILNWRYDPPYDFYNNELNSDSMKEMLEDSYSIVLDQNDSALT
jgi:[ribosomal protein S18]-alanine N-acetyltransferase